jgi:hypothetical protein
VVILPDMPLPPSVDRRDTTLHTFGRFKRQAVSL